MIILLTGDNDYRTKQSLDHLLADARANQGDDSIRRLDGAALSPEDLPQLLTGTNLFSTEQTIVIHDPGRVKAVWERLGELFEHIDDGTSLILVDPKPDKRTRTYKALQQIGEVRVHSEPTESELISWLQAHARDQGLNLEPSAARYLIQYAGTDQWRLHHDVAKLVALKRTVTPELIREVIEPEPQASAFEVLDAALSGDQVAAQAQLDILAVTEDPYRFFGLLASQSYAIAVCKAAGSRPPDQVAREAGLHPFVAKKTLALVRRYDSHDVKRLTKLVADCDVRMKSTGADPWTLMKLTIGAIAARS